MEELREDSQEKKKVNGGRKIKHSWMQEQVVTEMTEGERQGAWELQAMVPFQDGVREILV